MTSNSTPNRSTLTVLVTALACAALALTGCVAATDGELADDEALERGDDALTSSKGARIFDDGGAKGCGRDFGHLAGYLDNLPLTGSSALFARVNIHFVARSSGSVTDWYKNPIRVEVANYGSCETLKLALVHELGHAYRALFLGDSGEFPASPTDAGTAAARRDQWARFMGQPSWSAAGSAARAACGASSSHCELSTDELFAETFRGLFYVKGNANVWCKGTAPCWIYNFYGSFPNPKHVGGLREWFSAPLDAGGARASARVFDPSFYGDRYDDLKNAFGGDGARLRDHWLSRGVLEARASSFSFDVGFYLARNPDLVNAFGPSDHARALDHYLAIGYAEGRPSSDVFDARYYLNSYLDLQNAFGKTNYAAATDHYVARGIIEGRKGSAAFDPQWYMAQNPDVANAFGATNWRLAALHWLKAGRHEGRKGAP